MSTTGPDRKLYRRFRSASASERRIVPAGRLVFCRARTTTPSFGTRGRPPGVGPDEIAAAILEGLESLPATVAMQSDCAAPIHTSFSPASQTVTSGADAVFTETISVDSSAPGGTYECKDWATLVGQWQTNFHNVNNNNSLDGGMFHSTAITSLQFAMTCGPAPSPPPANANWSNFTATGRFNGVDGWSVDVRAADYGEPSKDNDSIRILLYDPSATLKYDSYSGGTPAGDFPANDVCSKADSVRHQLDAGNLQIHSGVKSP